MSVQKAQYEITSSEFLEWIAYLDLEEEMLKKEDYYFANIAAEVRRSWVQDKQKVDVNSFLMKWKRKEIKKKKPMSKEEITKSHKTFWGVILNVVKGNKENKWKH